VVQHSTTRPSYFSPKTLPTVDKAIIIIYIAGYTSCKITKKTVCGKCAAGLVGLLNKANSFHVFIAAKQYQNIPTGVLVVLSSDLTEVCTLIEAEFRNNVEKILHISKVNSILVTLMLSKIQGKLECDYCKTLQFVLHLYINILLCHVLPVDSRQFNSCKGKNRLALI